MGAHRHEATKRRPTCACGRVAEVVTCAAPGCKAWAVSFSRWDSSVLHEKGWTFRLDGTAHCPRHMPEWARQRRLAKAGAAAGRPLSEDGPHERRET